MEAAITLEAQHSVGWPGEQSQIVKRQAEREMSSSKVPMEIPERRALIPSNEALSMTKPMQKRQPRPGSRESTALTKMPWTPMTKAPKVYRSANGFRRE